MDVWRGTRMILQAVDITVERGEVHVIVGPNGGGKSTLLSALGGLLPIGGGTIEREGRVATVLQAPALARRSALDNVILATRWAGPRRSRTERATRARAALEALGAGHLAERPAADLSGGEARRVHLARGLVAEPDVLLLDEPFAGLDPSTRADLLYDAASALRTASRATVVVVHDRAEAWALADRVSVLIDGVIRATGTPAEVFEHPASEAVAHFVGFVGRLERDGGVIRLRPSDVRITDHGLEAGTVSRVVPVEDGVRVEITTSLPMTGTADQAGHVGSVVAITAAPGPARATPVRFDVVGGIYYPNETAIDPRRSATPLAPLGRINRE